MKTTITSFLLCICLPFFSIAQEQMEVAGAITIQNSNSNDPSEGTIRWNPTTQDFEGYDGSTWLSLTEGAGSTPVLPPMTEEKQYATSSRIFEAQNGYAVAIEGEYAFVGAPNGFQNKGAVHVFKYVGDQWIENQTLIASNGQIGDGFGSSVAVSGDKLIIGSFLDDGMSDMDTGKVHFFQFDGLDWSERQWLYTPIGAGKCVDICGNFAIVGRSRSSRINNLYNGSAEVFEFNGSTWNSTQLVFDSPFQTEARVGNAVAISKKWAVIGAASFDGPSTTNQGKVIIYKNTGNIWQYETEIVGPLAQEFENFGYDVSISGDTIAVSAVGTTVGGKIFAGSVYMYAWDGQSWNRYDNITLSSPSSFDLLGQAISLNKNALLISSHQYDITGGTNQGIVLRYHFNGSNWKLQEEYTDPDNQDNGEYGWSLDMDGIHRIVGMPKATIPSEYGKVVIGPLIKE